MQVACSCTMPGPTFQVVCPSDADIERATRELKGRVPPHMVRDVLFMHNIPDVYREAFLTAAQQVQAVEPDLRRKWMSRVSAWKDSRFADDSGRDSKTSNDAQRSSLGSRDTYQSFTSATSASSSAFSFTKSGAYESGGAQGIHGQATMQASDVRYNFPPLSPVFDDAPNTVPIGTHSITTAGQPFGPSGSFPSQANHQDSFVEQHVPPQDVSTLKMDEMISRFPKPGGGEKSASKFKAKWKCPVCGKGCTRSVQMRVHVDSQCLNPKQYLCLGCGLRSLRQEDVRKHCQSSILCHAYRPQEIAPPARSKYASCLTGKLWDTEEELIESTLR